MTKARAKQRRKVTAARTATANQYTLEWLRRVGADSRLSYGSILTAATLYVMAQGRPKFHATDAEIAKACDQLADELDAGQHPEIAAVLAHRKIGPSFGDIEPEVPDFDEAMFHG